MYFVQWSLYHVSIRLLDIGPGLKFYCYIWRLYRDNFVAYVYSDPALIVSTVKLVIIGHEVHLSYVWDLLDMVTIMRWSY